MNIYIYIYRCIHWYRLHWLLRMLISCFTLMLPCVTHDCLWQLWKAWGRGTSEIEAMLIFDTHIVLGATLQAPWQPAVSVLVPVVPYSRVLSMTWATPLGPFQPYWTPLHEVCELASCNLADCWWLSIWRVAEFVRCKLPWCNRMLCLSQCWHLTSLKWVLQRLVAWLPPFGCGTSHAGRTSRRHKAPCTTQR